MPAAVSDRPPRNGPIRRYFIPLKGFSSGFDDSAASLSLSAVPAVWAGCPVWVVCTGLTAFDCRSGLVCARTPVAKKIENVITKTNRAIRDAGLQKLSGDMFKLS